MICLFHAPDQADAAIQELVQAGIPKDSIGVMANAGTAAANPAAMDKWKVPERDAQLLTEGTNKGGVVIAVSTNDTMTDKVEAIFGRHQAAQIDEVVATTAPAARAVKPAATNTTVGGTIDVVEETMTVGKRAVQRGGIRVFQRVIEKPVSATVNLREEHVTVERHPVNRPVTAADAAFTNQSFAVTENSEEAVVAKTAKVVEEVVIGKESSMRTETVKGTVRKTDVTVEKIEPETKNVKPVKR